MYYIKLALVLLLIAGVAAALLAFINGKTAPIIAASKKLAEEEARKEVLPDAAYYMLDSLAVEGGQAKSSLDALLLHDDTGGGQFYFYRCYDNAQDMNFVGYIFTAYGKGYSSTIQTMCGVKAADDGSLELNAVKILYQQETPGLGANADANGGDNKFLNQFQSDKSGQCLTTGQLHVDKDGGEIISITGATISSRAITNSIREGMDHLPAPPAAQEKPADETPAPAEEEAA